MTTDVEKWLRALPEESIEAELEELRAERQATDQKIEVREQALAMKRSFAAEGPSNGAASQETPQPQSQPTQVRAMSPPIRGREAIRKVIADTPNKEEWTIPEMLKAILDRGWIANTHAVQVNLSRMYRDGELFKRETGVYCTHAKRRDLLASAQEAQE